VVQNLFVPHRSITRACSRDTGGVLLMVSYNNINNNNNNNNNNNEQRNTGTEIDITSSLVQRYEGYNILLFAQLKKKKIYI